MIAKMGPINAVDASFAQRIFDVLLANPCITEAQIAKLLHTYPLAVRPMLTRMVERECVNKASRGFIRTYSVTEQIAEAKRSVQAAEVHKPLSLDYLRAMHFAMNKRPT